MSTLISTLLILIIISLCTPLLSGASSIVEETCKNVSSSHPKIAYDFCVSSFESYENSSLATDRRTLAVIASRLTNSTAVKMAMRIRELMEVETNEPRRNRLNVCMEEYSNAIDELNNAVRAIDACRDTDARTFLSAAMDAASNCEDAFAEAEDASPLEAEDCQYGQQAAIALAIVAALHAQMID